MPPSIKHGTVYAYKRLECRCPECKMAAYNHTKGTVPYEVWEAKISRTIHLVNKWDKIKDHISAGLSDAEIARRTGMSRPTVQRTRIKYQGKP
jgi:hypothetical protein